MTLRLRSGRRSKEKRGGYGGGFVRYGWAVVGQGKDAQLVEVEEEQAVLRRIRRLRKRHTLRSIADRLNRERPGEGRRSLASHLSPLGAALRGLTPS